MDGEKGGRKPQKEEREGSSPVEVLENGPEPSPGKGRRLTNLNRLFL